MITMQLTATDIADARRFLDTAVIKRGDSGAALLYRSLAIASATRVGTTYEVAPIRGRFRVTWGLRAARKQLDRGPT